MYERPRGFRGLFRSLEEKVHPIPLKERVDQALYRLATQKEKLEHMSSRLQQRDKEMFQRCIGAQLSKDSAHAALYANECAEIRKMAHITLSSELALERVVLRLQTIEEFGDIMPRIAPVIGVEEEQELPLEQRVLDYIKSHNGELSLNSASEELAVPADDIRGSLQKLKDDGKIVMD